MGLRLDGRVVLITGAGRGLGRAYALCLAALGAKIVVNDLGVAMDSSTDDADIAQSVVDEILAAGGEAVANGDNVLTAAPAIVQRAIDAFGRLDVVINNAGPLTGTLFSETAPEVWQRQFDVHMKGTVGICRAAWPHLVASGSGRIINTGSSALFGNSWMTSYGGAKGGIVGFTQSLAIEGEPHGINVNCIFPTAYTRMAEAMEDERITSAMREGFQPDRIAPFVAWLVHPETSVNRGMFEVGAGQASRLAFAYRPFVKVAADTAAAWADAEEALMAEGPLTPIKSTWNMLTTELATAFPHLSDIDRDGDIKKTKT